MSEFIGGCITGGISLLKTSCDDKHECYNSNSEKCSYYKCCSSKKYNSTDCVTCKEKNCCTASRRDPLKSWIYKCVYEPAWPENQQDRI